MRLVGIPDILSEEWKQKTFRRMIASREYDPRNTKVSAAVGDSCVLSCPNKSDVFMVIWKINPKTGGHCTLGYRADLKQTNNTNCTENMSWKWRTDHDPTLHIRPVGRASEGNYTCEVVTEEGNFHLTYHLTVLVPPKLTVYCDSRGNPVCKAVAGKPAAQIRWAPESYSSPEKEDHGDGTVTVLSTFMGNGTDVNSTTCLVSHAAMNHNQTIACLSNYWSYCKRELKFSLSMMMYCPF
ncbi:cell surface glycoprotein CD200 receptor 1-B-like [Apteryx rowi]|uniref:cell surface glycoprotein CD200 receptor 1-B-like n=1 Tax=Apteryx rowi TaxID=308060 RepID=UPI000E1C8119|nr:cell surface glycoprotein CD200 receptor 1-B-like [Apteryx rowi]